MKKEYILCAAIWINDGKTHEGQPLNIQSGFVICGRRHHNCYETIAALTSQTVNDFIASITDENIDAMTTEDYRNHQGFITSWDRYVNRKEAWKIAKENDQIQFGLNASENEEYSILISENLY